MNKKTIVCCHAPSLAFLLYETNCALNNQIGVLLGKAQNIITSSTTDENAANEEEIKQIYVEHCIPFPQRIQFNSIGEFDEKLMDTFCAPLKGEIIGWYSFRRNVKTNSCSLRESLIHQHFLRYFKVLPENFIVGLVAGNIYACRSTHGFSYKFLRHINKGYESLKFKIYCLSDKTNGYFTNTTFPVSEDFLQTQVSLPRQSAFSTVNKIQELSMEKLSDLNLNLQKLEKKRNVLESEVRDLRRILRKKEISNININPSTRTKESADSLVYFNPNRQYAINKEENPIKKSIYEGIKINDDLKPDDDVIMSTAPETSAQNSPEVVAEQESTVHSKPPVCMWSSMNEMGKKSKEEPTKSPGNPR